MDWATWFSGSAIGCLTFMGKLLLIIVPLMIGVELMNYFHLVEKLDKPLAPVMGFLGLPSRAAYPLAAGLLLGMAYGGSLIIEDAHKGAYTPRQLMLISIFFCLCHSIFEDHILIMALGAPGIQLLLIRLVLAVFIVAAISRIWRCFPAQNKNAKKTSL